MNVERIVAYGCATAITIAALALGHDGQLAAIAVVGMLGLDKVLDKLSSKKEETKKA